MDAVQNSHRTTLLYVAGVIGLSTALHVVPQMLRDFVNPAWSMLVLMAVDAIVVSLIVGSRSAAWASLMFAALLGALMVTHQNVLAALPSIALNVLLAAVFGATLRHGSIPLLVRIEEASAPHSLAPAFVQYLRQLTAHGRCCSWQWQPLPCADLYAPYEWWSLLSTSSPAVVRLSSSSVARTRVGFYHCRSYAARHRLNGLCVSAAASTARE